MSDLIEFLRARLDDDTAEITKHPDGEDHWSSDQLSATGETNYPCFPYLQIHKQRALAEVETKRRIIDRYETQVDKAAENAMEEDRAWILGEIVSLLALPYATHPDYDESWRS